MNIIDLDHNQNTHQDTDVTVAGIVRATYTKPFSYFLIEDASGTLICRPNGSFPRAGDHVTITGRFVVTTPENCTVQLAILRETHREYIVHQTYNCDLPNCQFAALPDTQTLNSLCA
jgi:hypothetical protein